MNQPHWPNPWHDDIVYVPVDELAAAMAPLAAQAGSLLTMDSNGITDMWSQYGAKLDAYVFKRPSFGDRHSIGVRYGAGGPDYLSPYGQYPEKIAELLRRYGD